MKIDSIAATPLAIDLFCGLGGWSDGLLAENYFVVGFDIERHVYGEDRYPAQLVIQDVRTLHGSQFREAALIVASPPCQEFSYMAMPWSRAKKIEAEYRDGTRDVKQLTELFDACFRIQREACEAAGHHIPLIVENVRGAQKWVGRSRWNFGSFHLWGDVPALMPIVWSGGMKGVPHRPSGHWTNPEENGSKGTRPYPNRGWTAGCAITLGLENYNGVKQGGDWFNASSQSISRQCSSKSSARKAASAMIAKIPRPLSEYIARTFLP